MTAVAALRSGAGDRVRMRCPGRRGRSPSSGLLEVMVRPVQTTAAGRLGRRLWRHPRARRSRRASRSARGSAEATIRDELVRILLERLDLPVVLDADGLWALAGAPRLGVRPAASDRAHAARGRACAARSGGSLARVRRAPARLGARGRRTSRSRRAAEGRGHAHRRARARTRSSPTSGTPAWPLRGAGTSSPGSWPHCSPRASSRSRGDRRSGGPGPRGRPCGREQRLRGDDRERRHRRALARALLTRAWVSRRREAPSNRERKGEP